MNEGARVFISCGQATEEERDIAAAIAGRFKESGYEPYVAVEQQNLQGLTASIFQELRNAEYFVFVDFRREELPTSDGTRKFRGSLFSHQELAIATYREVQAVVLRESGVELSGISRYIQENATQFTVREHLPAIVSDEVRRRGWDPHWRDELSLSDEHPYYDEAQRIWHGQRYPTRSWHIPVMNRHKTKAAINCYAHLSDIVDLTSNQPVPVETIEVKWSGSTIPSALIPPKRRRSIDAFHVEDWTRIRRAESRRIGFNFFADWSGAYPQLEASREYELTYSVISENFPLVTGTFKVEFPGNPWDAKLIRC